jgi:hypothetical protein
MALLGQVGVKYIAADALAWRLQAGKNRYEQ